MTNDQLTAILAERVMGWSVSPDRFMTANRGWMPRWRFQPLTCLDDAFQLLKMAAAALVLTTAGEGTFAAQVRVGDRTSRASSASVATSITVAIASVIGLDVPDGLARSSVAALQMKGERRKR
jgi:hypothetical protein